jgi:hypothetical protein
MSNENILNGEINNRCQTVFQNASRARADLKRRSDFCFHFYCVKPALKIRDII